MQRKKYYDYIEEKLNLLALRVKSNGGLNLLELNLHSENFYCDLFNILFDYKLKNLNSQKQNVAGIDLIDETEKIVIQVSATATKAKVEKSLAKLNNYADYSFKFISITTDGDNLIGKPYANPFNLSFNTDTDIYNVNSILRLIFSLKIDKMEKVYELVNKELKADTDPAKVESNLTKIIQILSGIDWAKERSRQTKPLPFDIDEKISFNSLKSSSRLIEEYKLHHFRLDKIYSEFDKEGKNKSLSVLNGLQSEYVRLQEDFTPDKLFTKIIDNVAEKIKSSANYSDMPVEELMMCVEILVVDAFVRCKIFANPGTEAC
jgi:hypothetical protein